MSLHRKIIQSFFVQVHHKLPSKGIYIHKNVRIAVYCTTLHNRGEGLVLLSVELQEKRSTAKAAISPRPITIFLDQLLAARQTPKPSLLVITNINITRGFSASILLCYNHQNGTKHLATTCITQNLPFLIMSEVNYALFLLLKSVVYILYPKPYIIFK